MISRSMRKLEFPSVIRLLSEQADTSLGRKMCEELMLAGNQSEARVERSFSIRLP